MNKQLRILIAELIGTLILVVAGPGTAILATGAFSGGKEASILEGLGGSVGVLGVSLAWAPDGLNDWNDWTMREAAKITEAACALTTN